MHQLFLTDSKYPTYTGDVFLSVLKICKPLGCEIILLCEVVTGRGVSSSFKRLMQILIILSKTVYEIVPLQCVRDQTDSSEQLL